MKEFRGKTINNPIMSMIGQMLADKVRKLNAPVGLSVQMLDQNELRKHSDADVELNKITNSNVMVGLMANSNATPIEMAFMLNQFLESAPDVAVALKFMSKLTDGDEVSSEDIESAIKDLMKDL